MNIAIIPKARYIFSRVPIKTPNAFLYINEKMNLQIQMETPETDPVKAI